MVRRLVKRMLEGLADWEAALCKPGDRLNWRRRFLRKMGVQVPKEFWIGRGLWLWGEGNLLLGERVAIGEFACVGNLCEVRIGDDFLSAHGLAINAGTHDMLTLEPGFKPITIGHRVWCGVNVTILSGVTIGDDVVLGAGSVVLSDIPSNSFAAGVPARVLKMLNRSSAGKMWSSFPNSMASDAP